MIPDPELEILRLKFKVEMLSVIVGMLCNSLSNTSPEVLNALREKLSMLREERDKNLPPVAYSEIEDLISIDFREVLGDVLEKIDHASPI